MTIATDLPTRTVTLAVTWDPEDHADPARWDWPTLLDLPDRDYVQLVSSDADEASSASRQHFIDTGRYLTHAETAEDEAAAEAALQEFEATLPDDAPALRAAFLARQERIAADPEAALSAAADEYHKAAGAVTEAALAVIDKAVKDRWPTSVAYVLQGFPTEDGGIGTELDEVHLPGAAGRLSEEDGNDDVAEVNESLWDALSYLAETTGDDYAGRTVFGEIPEEAL